MNYKKLVLDAAHRMVNTKMTLDTWGNISARDPETGRVYLTPSAMDYSIMREEDIVVADLDGNILEGTRKPTIETSLHLGIYKNRPDVNAIVHTHPIYSQVFAVLREEIPAIIDEAAQILGKGVQVAAYGLPGSPELAAHCVEALGDGYACLLANHGAVCVGADANFAFKVCGVLEMTAQIYYMARCIGKPVALTEEQIAIMHDFAFNHYGK